MDNSAQSLSSQRSRVSSINKDVNPEDKRRTRTRSAAPRDVRPTRLTTHPRSQSVPIPPRLSTDTKELQNQPTSDSSDESDDSDALQDGQDGDRSDVKITKPLPANSLVSTMSSLSELAALAARAQDSGSSSGSGSTITQASFSRQIEPLLPLRSDLTENNKRRPDVLSFLDPDSPAVTEESIRRYVHEASRWRKRPAIKTASSAGSTSSSSSDFSSFRSDSSSPHPDSEPGTSPENSEGSECSPTPRVASSSSNLRGAIHRQDTQQPAHRYGTPEMPRGAGSQPHFRPNLTPRAPNHGHVKYLPRAEKLPLTGYELLASRISSQSPRPSSPLPSFPSSSHNRRGSTSSARSSRDDGPVLKPIYRRFEALNHRLLLHLQDELSELEEQLRRLDTADTQTRRLQNRILPASRRAEFLAGGELQWHKTDILGKVGYKLGQYNHVLSTFTETARLPAPSPADVDAYRTYLATQQPIAEIETRFLDPVDDLIALASPPRQPQQPRYQAQPPDLRCHAPTTASIRAEYLQSLDDDPAMQTPVPPPRSGFPYPHHTTQQEYLHRPTSSASSEAAASSPADSRPATSQGEIHPVPIRSSLATHPPPIEPASAAMIVPHGDMPHLALSVAVAVLVPVLMFAVIPGFLGRMAVVLLVALGVFGAQAQIGCAANDKSIDPESSNAIVIESRQLSHKDSGPDGIGSKEMLLCAGVYGSVMAVVAGLLA